MLGFCNCKLKGIYIWLMIKLRIGKDKRRVFYDYIVFFIVILKVCMINIGKILWIKEIRNEGG